MSSGEGSSDEATRQQEEDSGRARLQGALADVLKRTFAAGLGAVFTTEEGIRRLVSDFSLPKDVASFLVGQAQGTKDEMFRLLGGEFGKWLERLDVQKELTRILTTVALEVKTEIRFVPSDKSVKPEIKRSVSVKRADQEEPAEPPAEPPDEGRS